MGLFDNKENGKGRHPSPTKERRMGRSASGNMTERNTIDTSRRGVVTRNQNNSSAL